MLEGAEITSEQRHCRQCFALRDSGRHQPSFALSALAFWMLLLAPCLHLASQAQSANGRNQQISEPCNLQIKRKIFFIKLNKPKKRKLPPVMERDNASDCPRRSPRGLHAHQSGHLHRTATIFFLPISLSLYIYISEKKTEKLPALPVQPACKQYRTALKQIYKQP